MNLYFRNSVLTVVVGAMLVLGSAITFYGLSTLRPNDIPWSDATAFSIFVGWLAATFVGAIVLLRFCKNSAPLMLTVMVLVFSIATGTLGELIFLGAYFLSASCLGRGIARQLGWKDSGREWPILFLLGTGVFGTVISWMSHLPLAYPGVYAFLMALPLLFFREELVSIVLATCRALTIRSNGDDAGTNPFLVCSTVAVGGIHFVVSLLPELGHDALAVHLFLPSYVKSLLEWSYDPALYVWALMPLHGDWLFALAYVLSGETAVKLLCLSHLYVLAILAFRFVIWAGGTKIGAFFCVLVILSTPIVFTLSSALFIDPIWASYLVAAAYVLFTLDNFDQAKQPYVLAGALLGFAFASKLGSLTYAPVFLLLYIAFRRNVFPDRGKLRPISAGLLTFGLVAAHHYLVAWIIADNPVFPFFNAFFESPYYPSVNFTNSFSSPYLSWDIPYQVVFNSDRFMEATNGVAGFQWLILLPAAVASAFLLRLQRPLTLLLLGVIPLILTFQGQTYLRYVLPSLILICSAIFASLSTKDSESARSSRYLGVFVGITLVLNLVFFCAGTWTYRTIPFSILFSSENMRDFLTQRLPARTLIAVANFVNQDKTPVAIISRRPVVGGLNSDVLYANWYNLHFYNRLKNLTDPNDFARLIREYSAEYVILSPYGLPADQIDIVKSSTDELFSLDGHSLRKIRPEYLYGDELLKNAAIDSAEGWFLAEGAKFDAQLAAFLVTVSNNATQLVPVVPLRRYLLTAVSSCYEQVTEGRLQVNWLDEDGRIIDVALSTFQCDFESKAYSMEVKAPSGATFGNVYAAGHGDLPLYFEALSLQ